MRKLNGIVVIAASLAVLSGCGSDKKDAEPSATATTVKPPTKAQFIATADKLCAAAQAKIDVLPLDPNLPAADLGSEVIAQAVPIQRALIEDLGKLTPPAGDEQTVDRLFEDVSDTLDDFEEGLRDNPAATLSVDFFADVNRAAGEYGFVNCSQ